MKSQDESSKWMLIAHAACCGGPLLLILLGGNVAYLLSLARSRSVWAGAILLLGSIAVVLIRRQRACQIQPPMGSPAEPSAADRPIRDIPSSVYTLEAGSHD